MFLRMTEFIGRRLVEELQRYWGNHAAYPDLKIQGKHGFGERPQQGIVVKVGPANQISTSADNFRGIVYSRVHLTYFPNHQGSFVEWVREDPSAIQPSANRTFPSPPGVYWLNLIKEEGQFVVMVDTVLDVRDETLRVLTPTRLLTKRPFVPRSIRIQVHPYKYVLAENEYTTDPEKGVVVLAKPLGKKEIAIAEYRYDAGERGPYKVMGNRPLTTAIPGVIVAVGRNLKEGDIVGVVVEPRQSATSLEYGGQWELTADIDIFARDVHDQRELADHSALYLWGTARSRLSSEGLELTSVSLGGDSEESYDENSQQPYFTTTLSVGCSTEWSTQVPLDTKIREARAFITTGDLPEGRPPGTDTEKLTPGVGGFDSRGILPVG